MLKIIRWIFGYVIFTAKGKFIERFMNLTARYGINLWNVKKKNNIFYATVMVSDYKKFRPIAKKTNVRLKIKKKCGLPFIMAKLKPRIGIIIGMICFLLVVYVMSLFIWSVDVTGNQKLKKEEILHTMSELGLSNGSCKSKLNIPDIEQNAMIKLPGLSWISVNIKGSLATISVQERIEPPSIVAKDKPCNIKAIRDGQIYRMEVYSGNAIINNGDAVTKGQLLVSGISEGLLGDGALKHADAKIIAYTKREIYEEVPFCQKVHQKTENEINRYSVKMFGLHIPLSLLPNPGDGYERSINKTQVTAKKISLPIEIFKENFTQFYDKEVVFNKDEVIRIAEEKICEREQNELKDIKILERQRESAIYDDNCFLKFTYYCEENIAVKEEILIN